MGGGGWNKSGGGLENFLKINKREGGRLFGPQEQMISSIDYVSSHYGFHRSLIDGKWPLL